MANQISILVKIDAFIWNELEQEVNLGYQKRNRVINNAIRVYVEFQDLRRNIRYSDDPEFRKKCIKEFMNRWVPGCLE